MPYVDPTFPTLDSNPAPNDEKKFRRTLVGTLSGLPDSDYHVTPTAAAGTGTDRAAPFAGMPAVIAATKGLVPGGAIDLQGYVLAGSGLPVSADITSAETLTVDEWGQYTGRAIPLNSASPFTLTINDAAITGTAQAGATGATLDEEGTALPSITLAAGASAVDDAYNFMALSITSGTGSGQSTTVVDYDGTTKIASVLDEWTTTPDATSVYSLAQLGPFNALIYQEGAGAVTIAATGGLTLRNLSGHTKTGGQYSMCSIAVIGTDLVLAGQTAA